MAGVTPRASAALINFESVLETGEAWLKWIDDTEGFKSIIAPNIPWGQLDSKQKGDVQRRLKEVQPSSQLLLNSLYLTMASSFEEFLRSTVQQTAADLFGGRKKYEDLSEDTRNLHLRESAKLLRRLDSMPEYMKVTTVELCSAIGSCVPGSDAVQVCVEVLGNVDGLIRLSSFFERMAVMGKQISFDTLGKSGDIAGALKIPTSKPRDVGKSLESCVSLISKNRNRIAHTGGTASDVSRALISEHREVLKAVAKVVSALQ